MKFQDFNQFSRGHQVRKELSDDKTEEQPAETSEKPAEEEIDIDLNDPQTEEAAVKIQVKLITKLNSLSLVRLLSADTKHEQNSLLGKIRR